MRTLWNSLNRKSRFGFVSHLQPGQEWDPVEFHVTGIRFVDRAMERFAEFGPYEPNRSSVLEIGCGVGRFLKPLACRFQHVCGVDISANMLETARQYCACLPNIELRLNDGRSLAGVPDRSVEYCFSAGVFQHITSIDVILSYLREALRVLKPHGVLLFQFEGNRTERVGSGQCGAKITATDLDSGLADLAYRIREVSIDPCDKVRNVVIVLEKPDDAASAPESDRSFARFPLSERRWISGVYDDVATKTLMHERQNGDMLPFTFYDERTGNGTT